MSQFPPQPFEPGPAFANPYDGFQSPRPGVVTGLSITAIALASLGLLCNGFALAIQLMIIAGGGKNPLVPGAPVMHDPSLNIFNAVSAVINLALAIALLAGGIGGLKLWPRARQGLIIWSAATIVWATFTVIIQFVWVLPATEQYMAQSQAQSGKALPANFAGVHTVQNFMLVVTWVLWCALPFLFLILWRSPRVVAAFNPMPEGAPPQGELPR